MNRREFLRLASSAVVSASVGSSLWARAAAAAPGPAGASPFRKPVAAAAAQRVETGERRQPDGERRVLRRLREKQDDVVGGVSRRRRWRRVGERFGHREGREAILRSRGEHAGVGEFARMVCIGDGVWDVHTATSLGLPCIGVGGGAGAERLAAAGAAHVVADFTDLEAILNALEDATLPMSG